MRALSRCVVGTLLAALPIAARAEVQKSVEQDLVQLRSGKRLEPSIPNASTRVAVFTYQDPDGTGLGDALAALVGREILLRAQVASIGVIRYEGALSGSADDPLSYFEKVDLLTAAQDVTASVWGAVRRDGKGIVIDTFAQLPRKTLHESFEWILRLPRRVGGESLVAELGPDRILVQRLEIPAGAVEGLREAARKLDQLREEPRDSSPPLAAPPKNAVYWFERKEGEWAHVRFEGSTGGWVRWAGHCTGPCAPLIHGASFVAGLLRYAEHRDLPVVAGTLAPDALAILGQLEAFQLVNKSPIRAKEVLGPWRSRMEKGEVLPGGAALANIDALIDVLIEVMSQPGPYDGRGLEPARARSIAFTLAKASQLDPRNGLVLQNLAVLFRVAGDEGRATLARELAREADPN